jgi:lipid-A-disaccharide synthase
MELMVVAGEPSGDQHAAALVAALKARDPSLTFFGMGGDKLAAEGFEAVHHIRELSVMGIVEVIPKIPHIMTMLGHLEAEAARRRPACAVLVDVPDFNFRLARRLKRLGIPVIWYVAPTVWAWREGRTELLRDLTQRLLCILPFEEKFLRDRGVNATYVGNPVLEQIPEAGPPEPFRRELGLDEQREVLAVLPGSRRSEIHRMLETLVQTARTMVAQRPGLQVVVPIAPGLERASVVAPFERAGVTATFVEGRAPWCVGASTLALVASGTATLEAGLMRRPLVAVYRLNALNYLVGRAMVKLDHFCLVNLLAGERVVPELLQGELTVDNIVAAAAPLWSGPAREACLAGLDRVRALLGPKGTSTRAAQAVLEVISTR